MLKTLVHLSGFQCHRMSRHTSSSSWPECQGFLRSQRIFRFPRCATWLHVNLNASINVIYLYDSILLFLSTNFLASSQVCTKFIFGLPLAFFSMLSTPFMFFHFTAYVTLSYLCGFESRSWQLWPWARHLTKIASLHQGCILLCVVIATLF